MALKSGYSYNTNLVTKACFKISWFKAIILICLAGLSGNIFANSVEYRIKAAYLYQFTKFTQWPDYRFSYQDSPIKICVLGRSPFGKALNSFSSKSSQGRRLIVEHPSSLEEISNCHVVFISKSEEKRLPQILQHIDHLPVLTVSDMEGFARRGGIIGFIPKHRKVGIEVNVKASLVAGAKLSSKLLEVAKIVSSRSGDNTP